jgi:hypothetical protein
LVSPIDVERHLCTGRSVEDVHEVLGRQTIHRDTVGGGDHVIGSKTGA